MGTAQHHGAPHRVKDRETGYTTDDLRRLCRRLGLSLGSNPRRMLEFWCERKVLPYRTRRRLGGRWVWAFPPTAAQCVEAIVHGKRKGITLGEIAETVRPLVESKPGGPEASSPAARPPARPPSSAADPAELVELVRDLWQGKDVGPRRVRLAADRLGISPAAVIDRLQAVRFLEIVRGAADTALTGNPKNQACPPKR